MGGDAMALQLYQSPATAARELAIREPYNEEARAQRLADAEVLEEKLKFITENVPVRVVNIMGSNAGAGSGEFHMYRQARRREQMRLERIDELDKQQREQQEKQARREELEAVELSKTAKRRAKRQRKKEKASASKRSKTGAAGSQDDEPEEEHHSSPATDAMPEVVLD